MVTPAERQEQALSDFTRMNSAEWVTTGCERGSEKESGVILWFPVQRVPCKGRCLQHRNWKEN